MQSGKYELHEIIGQGGFGTVYRATGRALERQVAVKVLHPQLTTGPDFGERFRKEARALVRLEHPQIVPVYEMAEIDGQFLIVMKLLVGGSLGTRLQQGPLAYPQAMSILGEVCAGLQAAHSQGIVHRDLKPGNILFDEAGRAVLTDFGLARLVLVSGTSAGSPGAEETPFYRAPELWRGKPPASPATDVYALGCILYEMLSGKVLFAGNSLEEISARHLVDGPAAGPGWPPPGAPAWVAEVVNRATQRAPEVRYLDAATFYAALLAFERAQRKEEEKARQAALQAAQEAVYLKAKAAGPKAEAEAIAGGEAEEVSVREAEEKARLDTERQKAEAQARAVREVEEKARREAEEAALQAARSAAERKTRREAERKARQAAEQAAQAAQQAALEAQEALARRKAEEKALQEEALHKAEAALLRAEAEAQARREAEDRAQPEARERVTHQEDGGHQENGAAPGDGARQARSFMLELAPGVIMEFVRVPAGEFRMGSDPRKDPLAAGEEQPQHTVLLSDYWIGKYPVTNRQYLAYVQSAGAKMPEHWQNNRIPPGLEFHPVVNVSWQDAVEFCAWLSGLAQKGSPAWKVHLPSEAEWEKAARGVDGRIYPWGDRAPGIKPAHFANWLKGTSEVGRFPESTSPYGVFDLTGNIWQWVADWYEPAYYRSRPERERDPQGPAKGRSRVLRGGAWHQFRYNVRAACRANYDPRKTRHNIGFRCAASLP